MKEVLKGMEEGRDEERFLAPQNPLGMTGLGEADGKKKQIPQA